MSARLAILSATIVIAAGCDIDWDMIDPDNATQPSASASSSAASGGSAGTTQVGGASSSQASGGTAGSMQAGAGGVGGDPASGGGGAGGMGGEPLGMWTNVQPVAELADLTSDSDDATFTDDLLELYFNSFRAGGEGASDIWMSLRNDPNDPWGAPTPVAELSTSSSETDPVVSADGLSFWLARTNGASRDIYVSTRTARTEPWSAPVLEAAILNDSMATDYPGRVTADLLLMYHTRSGVVYAAERSNAAMPWTTSLPVPSLMAEITQRPWLSNDRLTAYFPLGDPAEIFMVSRANATDDWPMPVLVAELDAGVEGETDPWVSPDQRYMLFTYGTAGSILNRQIWEARR